MSPNCIKRLGNYHFAMACRHLPQYPFHQLCHRPPDDRPERRRSQIGRFKPNIQQYLAEDPLCNTSYKSAISSIHQDTIRTAIESSSSKLLNSRPPPIATAEQTLPMKTRTILAQLRTGHSRILGQYMYGIDPTARNHCYNFGQAPHDTHHLLDCPSKPTTLTVESLWTAPTKPQNTSTWWLMRRANNNNNSYSENIHMLVGYKSCDFSSFFSFVAQTAH